MNPLYIEIGDKVANSPAGPGEVTGFTDDGFVFVNHMAVAIFQRADGKWWNPLGIDTEAAVRQWKELDEQKNIVQTGENT